MDLSASQKHGMLASCRDLFCCPSLRRLSLEVAGKFRWSKSCFRSVLIDPVPKTHPSSLHAEYAQVIKIHGGPWLEAYCFDGQVSLLLPFCLVPGPSIQ